MNDVVIVFGLGMWGGITVFLAGVAIHFRNEFMKALAYIRGVEVMVERPNVAMFSEEQVDSLAAHLGARISGKKEYLQ